MESSNGLTIQVNLYCHRLIQYRGQQACLRLQICQIKFLLTKVIASTQQAEISRTLASSGIDSKNITLRRTIFSHTSRKSRYFFPKSFSSQNSDVFVRKKGSHYLGKYHYLGCHYYE